MSTARFNFDPEITGIWHVRCEKFYGSKKRSNRVHWVYVRAETQELAEKVGRAVTGLRYASAYVYQPWKDLSFTGAGWLCVEALT